MRLIDADKIDFNEVFVGASKFAEDTRQAGKMLIDAQPTAYDVDKVVEQLKNEKEFWSDANAHNKEIVKQKARSYAYAIEIVKGGGIDENTNT